DYKVSAFDTGDVVKNATFAEDSSSDEHFRQRFAERPLLYTFNGRSALNMASRCLALRADDIVSVLTTSGHTAPRGCVTGEIVKFCRWNREIGSGTRAILVVHEFGYPYEDLQALRSFGLPIIEDAAYAFYSEDAAH